MNYFLKTTSLITDPIRAIQMLNRKFFKVHRTNPDKDITYMNSWLYGHRPRVPLITIFPGIEKISYCIKYGFNRTPDVSITILETNAICAIAAYISAKNVLEIGTYDGGTALNLAANIAEEGRVYTVDLPKEFAGYAYKVGSLVDNRSAPEKIGLLYKGTCLENKIVQIYQDSAKLDFSDKNLVFDLIFIDGCHSYNYIVSDFLLAQKYIKKGGIIILHDYGMLEDVSKFVDIRRDINFQCVSGTRLALVIN